MLTGISIGKFGSFENFSYRESSLAANMRTGKSKNLCTPPVNAQRIKSGEYDVFGKSRSRTTGMQEKWCRGDGKQQVSRIYQYLSQLKEQITTILNADPTASSSPPNISLFLYQHSQIQPTLEQIYKQSLQHIINHSTKIKKLKHRLQSVHRNIIQIWEPDLTELELQLQGEESGFYEWVRVGELVMWVRGRFRGMERAIGGWDGLNGVCKQNGGEKQQQDDKKSKQRQNRHQDTQKKAGKEKNISKQIDKPKILKDQKIFPKKAMLSQKHKSLSSHQYKKIQHKQILKQQQNQLDDQRQLKQKQISAQGQQKAHQIQVQAQQKFQQKKQISQIMNQSKIQISKLQQEIYKDIIRSYNKKNTSNLTGLNDHDSNVEVFRHSNSHNSKIDTDSLTMHSITTNIPKKLQASTKSSTQNTQTNTDSSATNSTSKNPIPLKCQSAAANHSYRQYSHHGQADDAQSGSYTPQLYLQPISGEEVEGQRQDDGQGQEQRERQKGVSFDQGHFVGSGCDILYEEDQDEENPELDELEQEQEDDYIYQDGQQANQKQLANFNQIQFLSTGQQQAKNKFQPYQDRIKVQNTKKDKKERVSDNKAKQLKKFLNKNPNPNCKSREKKCGRKSSSQILINRNNDKSKQKHSEKKIKDKNGKRTLKEKYIFKDKDKDKDKAKDKNVKMLDKQKNQKSKTKIIDKDKTKITQKYKSPSSPLKVRSQY